MSAQSTADVLGAQRKMAEAIPYNDDPTAIDETQGKVRTILQKGKAKATEMEKGFEHYVQDKPIQTVLIATGVGLLVGYMFGRRR